MSKYDIRITVDTPDNVCDLRIYIDKLYKIQNTKKEKADDQYDCSLIRRYENRENYKIMTKLAWLKEITYYLIQFFFMTKKKYSCTQTKLGKLLSILAFKYARRGDVLFEIPIYRYPPRCGTLIRDLTFIPKDIYERDFTDGNPDSRNMVNVLIDKEVIIERPYDEVEHLSTELKGDIEDLFIHFGAYPADQLGRLLNPIVDKIVDETSDKLQPEKLKYLQKDDIDVEEKNEIVDYLYSN